MQYCVGLMLVSHPEALRASFHFLVWPKTSNAGGGPRAAVVTPVARSAQSAYRQQSAPAWTSSIAQAAGCCRTSGFLDLDLLLLLRHLRRLWQFDSQYALIKLRLDFRWIWIERQGIARLNEP